jgi:hypothetical protein
VKSVLIITYYWPPSAGPGVQRWLKFVKYLPEFGVQPIVYTPSNVEYPVETSNTYIKDIPSIKIVKQPIKEPYRYLPSIFSKKIQSLRRGIISSDNKRGFIERFLLFVRGNFFIPDSRVSWVSPSIEFLKDYITKNKIDTIITTGPPHSLHLIGLGLKQITDINWIADFRDPWTSIGYHDKLYLTKISRDKHKKLELKVLHNADRVVATSIATASLLTKISNRDVEVVTNGFDGSVDTKINEDTNSFTILHTGSISADRNPDLLWRTLAELVEENTTIKSCLKIQLIGDVSPEVINSIKGYNLLSHVDNLGYLEHSEVATAQALANVLLLLQANTESAQYIIPAKIFEYFSSGRPILAIGPNKSDAKHLIAQTNTGFYVNYSEYIKLKEYVLELYNSHQKRDTIFSPIGVEKFHRRELTKQLAIIIKGIKKPKSE